MPKKLTQYPQKSRQGQEQWSLQEAKGEKAQEQFMKQLSPSDAPKKGRPKKK